MRMVAGSDFSSGLVWGVSLGPLGGNLGDPPLFRCSVGWVVKVESK